MPRKAKVPDPPPKPSRRPPNMGSVGVRSNGRVFVVQPKDVDPDRRVRYGPGDRSRWASVEAATAWLDAAIARARRPPDRPGGPRESLGAYLARWIRLHDSGDTATGWPPRTAAAYKRTARRFAGIADIAVGDLTHEHVLGALAALGRPCWRRNGRGPLKPYGASTIRQSRDVLQTALAELVPHVLPFNPVTRARLGRRQEQEQPVWDAEQLERFEVKALEMRPDLYFPLRLVTRRAFRRGEVLATESTDLDMRRRVVQIDETAGDRAGETGDTKGRRIRDVPLGELAGDAQLHMAKRRPRPSRWLVPGRRVDKPLSLRQFNVVVGQIIEAAGLPKITPKDMRATAATVLLDQNVSLARVSRLLGHSSMAVTSRFYDRVQRGTQERVDELAEDFDAAFRRATVEKSAPEVSLEVSGDSATR